MSFKFSDEEFEELKNEIDFMRGIDKAQGIWEEKAAMMYATLFDYLKSAVHLFPLARVLMQVDSESLTVAELKKDWEEVKHQMDFYFEMIFLALSKVEKMEEKEGSTDEKKEQ